MSLAGETRLLAPTGRTRLFGILGDPIAQVKSPTTISRMLAERGVDALLVPFHVAAADLDGFMTGVAALRNLDGLVLTVPHKVAAFRHAATASQRARFLGAVNALRRRCDGGGWHGEMFDGAGLVGALAAAGIDPAGRRALLVGAGGAGRAVALALVEAGIAALAVHDIDSDRRDDLVGSLRARAACPVDAADTDPADADLVVNATPVGMAPSDPLPVRADRLSPGTVVVDAVTDPVRTALLDAAARRGCTTVEGSAMHGAQVAMLVDFLTRRPE